MCGFEHANGDYIITLDDDLQNPPEEIPKLISKIHEFDYDCVFGILKRKSTIYSGTGNKNCQTDSEIFIHKTEISDHLISELLSVK